MRKILATLALGLAAVTGAHAQAWPAKPVTLLVPFPPGGSTDLIARTLGAKLQEKLGGTFIIDNKAGAGGTVGAAQAKRSAPDGYTIFVSSLGPFVIGPHLVKNPGYDPLKDFDYITVAVQAPNVLTVPANSPHKTFADLFKFIKANPDKMTFASAGNGTSDHLTAELFWQETGTKGIHVPYKGGAPAMQDMLAGLSHVMFANISDVLPQVKAGKLTPIAVTTPKRSAVVPDVPTLAESGYPGFSFATWQAVVGPPGLPREIVERLNTEIRAAMATADSQAQFLSFGTDAATSSPDELSRLLSSEVAKIKKIAQSVDTTR